MYTQENAQRENVQICVNLCGKFKSRQKAIFLF